MEQTNAEGPTGAPGGMRSDAVPLLVRGGVSALLVVVVLVSAWAVAGALGPGVRRVAMVPTDVGPEGSVVSFDDASERAVAFLAERDSVTLVAPWTMPAADLLRLYHLENNLSARRALQEQLPATASGGLVPEGTTVSFVLTPERRLP